MHPSLDKVLTDLNVIPDDLCEFTEETKAALRLRVGSVSCKDPHALQFHLDELDAAVAEVSRFRHEAVYTQAEVQRRMREVQREYVLRPDLKITQAERLYKIDEEHRALETALTKLVSAAKYAETVEDLLRNKYFEIKAKAKLG